MPTLRCIELTVNGTVQTATAGPSVSLLQALRHDLGLNGPKYGCGLGQCGACMVLLDGKAARSCVLPVAAAAGLAVTTLEGLARDGFLHPVQRAFIAEQGTQCGFCLNGMIMRTVALLEHAPSPTDAEIRDALKYNLCRCGAHEEILRSVHRAAASLSDERRSGTGRSGTGPADTRPGG